MNTHLITLKMLSIIIAITMAGCGGGSEEEKESSPTETVVITTAASEDLPIETINTSSLISNVDFDFTSGDELKVTLPASPSTSIGYFVNICTNFIDESNEVKIDYDSCKLRTTLASQKRSFTLSLSTSESVFIAQIWPIENAAKPITVYWNIVELGRSWKIAM